MSITNVCISTESIPFRNRDGSMGTITVRGVTVSDLMQAAHRYGPQLVLVFSKVMQDGAGSLGEAQVRKAIWEVSAEFPDLLASILAMAADEFNDAGVALMRRLPMDKQAEVLRAVFSLSLSSEGSLEKLMALMVDWLVEIRTAMNAAGLTSMTGIGDSAAA